MQVAVAQMAIAHDVALGRQPADQRPGTDAAAFLARGGPLEHAVFDLVDRLGGSISAEHGIGRLKTAEFAARADPVELSVMRDLKRALDPKGILNPGKVFAC
jgi:FAD/FMN-containing dehydrogenase